MSSKRSLGNHLASVRVKLKLGCCWNSSRKRRWRRRRGGRERRIERVSKMRGREEIECIHTHDMELRREELGVSWRRYVRVYSLSHLLLLFIRVS